MNGIQRKATNSSKRGQTLVMALILLGVLLVLGVVFIGLVNKNIGNAVKGHRRSVAYDLAEAGVRYAHNQMLISLQGADWRPIPTVLPIRLDDPDYDYLKMPNPADPSDYGGPDKRGPYTRLIFDRGRTLVRVRYAPSDPTIFSSTAIGDLIQPGVARDYTIIESVGKSGNFALNDPTQKSTLSSGAVDITESKKVIAFVSCGLIEHARFITNKVHVSAAAEIGFPTDPGVMYGDNANPMQTVQVPIVLGNIDNMLNPYNATFNGGPIGNTANVPYGGGFFSNADLLIHGMLIDNANALLGDGFQCAGSVQGADQFATLMINGAHLDVTIPANPLWTLASQTMVNNGAPFALNSDSPNFNTFGGLYRDAFQNGDNQGWPRSIPFDDAPSILTPDPDTGRNRYVQMTQYSGKVFSFFNSGTFGHGQGVYVGNSADIQMPTDEQGRQDVGAAESLVYDWLNPNNAQANSGWQGAFYVPRGAYLRLFNDGFMIIRDGRAPANQRTWKEPDGSPSKRPGAQMNSVNPADIIDSASIRYKLVPDPLTGQVYIFNSYSVMPSGTVVDLKLIDSTTINNWRPAGFPFNGVLYFAGNVRVRGQIPTDMQLTVVSGATIYIEGSITKGVVNNGTRNGIAIGRRIDSPSKSMLALLATDYVTLNTTQFFGTSPLQNLEEVKDNAGPIEWNPIRVRTGGTLDFITEFDLDPNTPPANGGNPLDPRTYKPFVTQYIPAGAVNGFESTNLLLAQATDDGPAPATFINLNVNDQLGASFAPDPGGEWQYLFDLSNNNAATPFYPLGFIQPHYNVANEAPLYGLGGQSWQRYSKFESGTFPLVTNNFAFTDIAGQAMEVNGANTSPSGLYHLLIEDNNNFTVGLSSTVGGTPTNDYVVARAAVVPHDIRIEATIFAEEGSFFVIPGPWFNPNPDDRRDTYPLLGATQAERDLARLENYGSTPNTPFYGEPLDVKISIFGSVNENMPPPISQQAEWLKKWGWIPRYHGASGELIPQQHTSGIDVTPGGANKMFVPNITITYDPALATDRNIGFVGAAGPGIDFNTVIRYQSLNVANGGPPVYVYYALPPLPRMPVSPTLAYFGEVNP
ncbi:MAG: hypothetical protein ACHQ50_01975 [Fimbriimonadales bacterium]